MTEYQSPDGQLQKDLPQIYTPDPDKPHLVEQTKMIFSIHRACLEESKKEGGSYALLFNAIMERLF